MSVFLCNRRYFSKLVSLLLILRKFPAFSQEFVRCPAIFSKIPAPEQEIVVAHNEANRAGKRLT